MTDLFFCNNLEEHFTLLDPTTKVLAFWTMQDVKLARQVAAAVQEISAG